MKYIQPPWENYFFSKVQSVEKSLYLSSPYIKNIVATLLYEVLRSKQNLNLSIQILTRITTQDLDDGASDLEAFEKLLQLEELEGVNAEIQCISNLHAKVYIFDQNSAIVTSSNLTPSGLNSNIEYGIEVTDPTAIQQMLIDMGNYWDRAEILTAAMLERLEITEPVVNQAAQQTENHSLIPNPSTSVNSIGKRLVPLGQDIKNPELDGLRDTISTSTSTYRKRTKVITPSEDSTDVEDELGVNSSLSTEKNKSSTMEVEAPYSELIEKEKKQPKLLKSAQTEHDFLENYGKRNEIKHKQIMLEGKLVWVPVKEKHRKIKKFRGSKSNKAGPKTKSKPFINAKIYNKT